MVDEIVQSTKEASRILAGLRILPKDGQQPQLLLPFLKKAVCFKLMIPETEEGRIQNLVIMSIKYQDMRAGGLPDVVIRHQIKKYDCHQTSLAARKKALLFLFMERELGIRLEDEEAVGIETMDQLAEAFARHLREG